MYHIYLSVNGHCSYFYVLAVVNSAAMNTGLHVSFWIRVLSGYIPRSRISGSSVQLLKSCLTLCNDMDCSTPVFSSHHQLPELAQTHVHWGSDAISIGASASKAVLAVNVQDWFPLELTCLISLLSNRLSRVFSNTTVQKHQFFSAQLSLWSSSHIHVWLLEKP